MAEALLGAVRVPDTWRDLAREYVAQILETPSGAASLTGLIHQLRNPTELGREPLVRSRTRRESLAEQLRLLSEGSQRFLYERGRRLDVQEMVTPFSKGKVPINVVWLPGLGDAQMRQRFVATVLSDVYAWMLRHPSSKPQLMIYLDEVGPFMPPIGEPPAKRVLGRIFKEGRKYGVCGIVLHAELHRCGLQGAFTGRHVATGPVRFHAGQGTCAQDASDAGRIRSGGSSGDAHERTGGPLSRIECGSLRCASCDAGA